MCVCVCVCVWGGESPNNLINHWRGDWVVKKQTNKTTLTITAILARMTKTSGKHLLGTDGQK